MADLDRWGVGVDKFAQAGALTLPLSFGIKEIERSPWPQRSKRDPE
jgi:hypothetical protein